MGTNGFTVESLYSVLERLNSASPGHIDIPLSEYTPEEREGIRSATVYACEKGWIEWPHPDYDADVFMQLMILSKGKEALSEHIKELQESM